MLSILKNIPARTPQPRTSGLTMIYDKGLSLAEARDLLEVAAPHIDMVKLAYGTAMFSGQLAEKIKLYQSYNITVFLGGLLFEAFIVRNEFDSYQKMLDKYELTTSEVSDGSISISQKEKLGYIETLAKRGMVLSEIGSKDKDKVKITPPYQWIELMQAELNAGAAYIIAEGKEAGTEGIYRDSGEVREGTVEEILTKIPGEKIIWEAPQKPQQVHFIKLLGCNANLGNIAPKETIALEAMRIGLRSDSFYLFLEQ